jgi:UDP-N-acetylbacillosamine N-acetyltransferase
LIKKVAIVGAGSHTKSSINLLMSYFNISDMCIYDSSFVEGEQEVINSIPLIGSIDDIELNQDVFLSIGDNNLREKYFLKFKDQVIKKNLFHESSLQEKDVKFGQSNQVFSHTYINSKTIIGDNNIINTGSIIEHDCEVGDHNHISIGAIIGGRASIGNKCFIGAGAVILNKLSVCDNVIIGAGAVVICNINEPGTYVGNPAKKIK